MAISRVARYCIVPLLLFACRDETKSTTDTDQSDTDVDIDTDTDTDADTDSDSDTDSDADTDADTDVPTFVFDTEHVLVIPDGDGLQLMNNDGTLAFSRTWNDLVGACPLCGGEGASADGDGLLLAFTLTGTAGEGGIARIDSSLAVAFRLDGFDFPHDAIRDPSDGSIVITETFEQQLTWIAGDGLSADPIRTSQDDPDWPGLTPNGNELFTYNGRNYLLVSHRGSGGSGGSGLITMWDITTPGDPQFQWQFPEEGNLNTPHGCIFREFDGQWWLVWAHTFGSSELGGTVGLAVGSNPVDPPVYVADLVPEVAFAPFQFLRGVELTEDGMLYLTDSGTVGFSLHDGRVISAPLPALAPTGASGALGEQVFVDLAGETLLLDGLAQPFEGWLWVPTFPL